MCVIRFGGAERCRRRSRLRGIWCARGISIDTPSMRFYARFAGLLQVTFEFTISTQDASHPSDWSVNAVDPTCTTAATGTRKIAAYFHPVAMFAGAPLWRDGTQRPAIYGSIVGGGNGNFSAGVLRRLKSATIVGSHTMIWNTPIALVARYRTQSCTLYPRFMSVR